MIFVYNDVIGCLVSDRSELNTTIYQLYQRSESFTKLFYYGVVVPDYTSGCYSIPQKFFNREQSLTRSIGNSRCLTEEPRGTTHLRERAVCPWHFEVSYDVNRKPALIPKAKCNCRRCRLERRRTCAQVSVKFPVLRRLFDQWEPTLEEVPVACVCV